MTDESTFRFDLHIGTSVQREDVAEGGSLRMKNAQSVDHLDDGYNTKNFSMEGESTGCHSDILDELLGDTELISTDGTLDGFLLSRELLTGEAGPGLQLHVETPGKREAEPEKKLEAKGQTADLELQEECKRDLKETIQLCEVLMSEKAAVVAECDFITRELRALQEENQSLRQEKEHLLKDIEERREMEEFRALEQESTRQCEKELVEEISSLKKAADAAGAHVQNLEMDLAAMVAELKRKENCITELQALRHKDSAQEIRQLKRSLQDAETLSRDTRKEWAVLRSEAQALRESESTMAEAHSKMGKEVQSLHGRLEAERKRFKEMEADLLKELQRTFQENDRLTAMQAATCPKDVEVGLRAQLELSQEKGRALQARVAELELSQEKGRALQARVAELELSQERERALQARVAELELSQEKGRALQARVAELELSQERERALQARVAELELSQEKGRALQARVAELELSQERERALQARVAELELSQERERALQDRMAELELSQERERALQDRMAELELSQERERALQDRMAELELSQERERALQDRMAELELSQERERALQDRMAELELSQERERALQTRVAELELSQERERALQTRVAELELSQERERTLQDRMAELELSRVRERALQDRMAELDLSQVEQISWKNKLGDHHVPSRRSEELNEENEQTQQVAEELEEVRKKREDLRDSLQWLDDNDEEEELRKSDADRSLRQQPCGREASQWQPRETRITGLEEALAKAEHSVAVHKEATQLLQTELQDVYAQLSERDDAIQALQRRLKEYPFNSGMELQRKDTAFRGDPKGVVLPSRNREDVEPIEEPLQKVKGTCRTPVHSDQSVMIDSGMSRNMLDATRGCTFQSPLMDKEAMRQLKNAHPESKVTSHQEAVKWRRRATQLKENRRETHPQKLQSPHTPTRGRRLVASSDGRIFDSPKSKFFDTHSDGVHLNCPRQFFDNSTLGAISDASPSLEHWSGTIQPLSPRQDDNCKAQ